MLNSNSSSFLLPAHPICGIASLHITQPNRWSSDSSLFLTVYSHICQVLLLPLPQGFLYLFTCFQSYLCCFSSGSHLSSGFYSRFIVDQTVHIIVSHYCYHFYKIKSSPFNRTFTYILCSKSLRAINLLEIAQRLPGAYGADLKGKEPHLTDLWVPHPKGLTTVASP